MKAILAIVLLLVLLYLTDIAALWQSLSQLRLSDILNLSLASIILIYISALKWGFFLEFLGSPVKVSRLFALYLLGYFVNLIMPSYLGGDVVRSFYIGKKVGQHEALSATIMERYTGLVAMVFLAFIFMWFVEQVTLEIKFSILVVALGLIAATYVVLVDWPLKFLEKYKPLASVVNNLRKIQNGFLLVKGDNSIIIKTILLSLLYHCFTVFNTIAAAWAVGWQQPPLLDLFVVLPVILLISAVPLTPQGLGLQEAAFFYFLQTLGASEPQAVGVAIILRAKSYILALLGGVVWWRERPV